MELNSSKNFAESLKQAGNGIHILILL